METSRSRTRCLLSPDTLGLHAVIFDTWFTLGFFCSASSKNLTCMCLHGMVWMNGCDDYGMVWMSGCDDFLWLCWLKMAHGRCSYELLQ